MNVSKHFTVSAYIANTKTRKILLIHHKIFNLWIGPGGHIDEHEDIEEALLREVREETGIKKLTLFSPEPIQKLGKSRGLRLQNFIELHTVPGDGGTRIKHDHINFVFYGKTDETKLVLAQHEHYDMGWFTIDEAKKLKTDKATIYHMEQVLKNI